MAFDADRLLKEVWFKATTSGGKGGQNVNKVATRVELYFDVVNSNVFTPDEQALLMQKLEPKLTEEGILRMVSSEERTQLKNKDKVQEKFLKLIEKTLLKPKPRKKTKPSESAKEERLTEKKKLGEKKKSRGSFQSDED